MDKDQIQEIRTVGLHFAKAKIALLTAKNTAFHELLSRRTDFKNDTERTAFLLSNTLLEETQMADAMSKKWIIDKIYGTEAIE